MCTCIHNTCFGYRNTSYMYDVIHTSVAHTMFPGKACSARTRDKQRSQTEREADAIQSTPRSIALISVYRHSFSSERFLVSVFCVVVVYFVTRSVYTPMVPSIFCRTCHCRFRCTVDSQNSQNKNCTLLSVPFVSYATMSLTIDLDAYFV